MKARSKALKSTTARRARRAPPPAVLIAALGILAAGAVFYGSSTAEAQRRAVLYKHPQCGCCKEYATYLRRNGYDVEVVATEGIGRIKREHGVPATLESCHTTLADGYVVEGHVPVGVVNRHLEEKSSAIRGIALPDMPAGSPGMNGTKLSSFTIYAIDSKASSGSRRAFAIE